MKTFYEILNIFSKSVKIFAFTFVVCGTMLMFVSCGETNDEPEPVDNCEYCDDNSCVNGNVCGGDKRLHTIGNGNYQFRDFMYDGMVNDKAVSAVNDAKSYMTVMMGNFEESLKGNASAQAYFADYIKNMKTVNYSVNYNFGIDLVINDINNHSKPIFVDIINYIDSPLDQLNTIRYIQGIALKSYNDKDTDDENYIREKHDAINGYKSNQEYFQSTDAFDFENDFNTNNCFEITNRLDKILQDQVIPNMAKKGININLEIMQNFINSSLPTVHGLDKVHDKMGNALDSHRSCAPLEAEGTIIDAMKDQFNKLYEANQSISNERSM